MKMPLKNVWSLRDRLDSASQSGRWFWGVSADVCLDDLRGATTLAVEPSSLAGRNVLVATDDPLTAALALMELDGIANRLVVGTPDLSDEHLQSILSKASIDAVVTDHPSSDLGAAPSLDVIASGPYFRPISLTHSEERTTEWVLLTSGTTGAPKMVVHSLATLTAPIAATPNDRPDVVWGTFYDIRRYGGMQIFLRALLGRGSFVVSGAGEPAGDYLARLAAHKATHVSGTATHWRRALMSTAAHSISPDYVRLSGEIADQAILNSLQSFFPNAKVGHAFASTEAGVAFEVNDGFEGFPADFAGRRGAVELDVTGDTLRIRSDRSALGYLHDPATPIADPDGFVDTGDMVERRGDRYYFLGRKTGVINVGGLKVYPEEVEAAINRHPAVRMSVVRSRRNPITGSLVAAEVVLNDPLLSVRLDQAGALRSEILQLCRETLAPHKIPATLRFVAKLDVGTAGKLARHGA